MQTIEETKSLFAANKRLTFILLCLITVLLLYVKKTFIENETAAFEFLQDRPEGGILQLISALQFLTIPLIYLWKFTVIAFVIWIGCFMFGYRVTYSQCWGITVVSEYIFIVPEVLKICWFMFIETDPNLLVIRAFYPFSMMTFFDYSEIDPKYAYPLKALNIFEIFYWILLVTGVHFFSRKEKKQAWIIVLSSYVLIFLFWILFYIIVYK
ncbi:MAG: hypothetical protein JJE09_05785 [Bacteroidia bacterium]|nr:hypothetical protein [Bacteroidia bacterium]